MISGILTLLRIVSWMMKRAERSGLINEGARRQLAKDVSAVIEAGDLAHDVRQEIASMTEDEVDDILRQ